MTQNNARTRLVRKYPAHTLEDILSISSVIFFDYASLPVDRHMLAKTIGTTINSSSFTTKLAASEDYGLTKGRYRDKEIAITPLGRSIVAPKDGSEHLKATKAAIFKPKPFAQLSELFGEEKIPEDEFLANLIVRELNVQQAQTKEFMSVYRSNLKYLGDLSREPVVVGDLTTSSPTNLHSTQNQDQQQNPSHIPARRLTETSSPRSGSLPNKIGVIKIGNALQAENRNTIVGSLTSLSIPIEEIAFNRDSTRDSTNFPSIKYSAVILFTQNLPDDYDSGYMHGLAVALSHGKTIILTNEQYKEAWNQLSEEVVAADPLEIEKTFVQLLQALIRYEAIKITTT